MLEFSSILLRDDGMYLRSEVTSFLEVSGLGLGDKGAVATLQPNTKEGQNQG